MLHRSFKSSKCKTSLKLASSRLKLLKNKKGVQISQMKRELAQLLESGQDSTARIRVEHVIREEKMVAAYDLIEIYCELIAARLPVIESQKNCPIDLKEAVASVVFASPRCADIAELLDIRKHFTAKYGKEFISAAIEVRPNCGVSRMLVEKLSAIAPDGPTKVKVLTAIAEEHNVTWEPKAFGEKDAKPPDDLLNGPNTFEKASKMHPESPKNQDSPRHYQKHETPSVSEQSTISSLGTQNFASLDSGGVNATMPVTSHPVVIPSEPGVERREAGQPFHGVDNAHSFGWQNWNMEFKDATAAAQVAALSAERASMAARAAAELSSGGRFSRQYSPEAQKTNIHGLRDEKPGNHATSKLSVEHLRNDSVNNSLHDKNPKVQNDQIDANEYHNLAERHDRDDYGSTKRSSHSASVKSGRTSSDEEDALLDHVQKIDRYSQRGSSEGERFADKGQYSSEMSMKKQFRNHESTKSSSHSASVKSIRTSSDEETLVDSVQRGDRFSRRSSSEEELFADKDPFSSETSMKKHFRESEGEFESGRQDGLFQNLAHFQEDNGKQFSASSSRSHSSTFSDDYNMSNNTDDKKLGNKAPEDPFVGIDTKSIHRDSMKTSSYNHDDAPLDESGSDGDVPRFDTGPKFDDDDEEESISSFPSPSRNSSPLPLTDTDSWGFARTMEKSPQISTSQTHSPTEWLSSPMFSESPPNIVDSSIADTVVPVTLDYSDVPNFDSEDELEKSRTHPRNEPTQVETHGLTGSSFVEPFPRPRKSPFELNDLVSESAHSNPVSRQSSRISVDHELSSESPDILEENEQSSSETGNELNFGTLTGGLRNKGYRHPPYTRNPSGDAYSSRSKAAEESSMPVEEVAPPSIRSSVNLRKSKDLDKKSSSSVTSAQTDSDSDSDDYEEEFRQQTPSSGWQSFNQKPIREVNTKMTLKAPVTYFDPETGDSDEDLPKQSFNSVSRRGSAFSRRTKAAAASSSNSKIQAESEASATSGSSTERKPMWSSYGSETPSRPRSQTGSWGNRGNNEQPSSTEVASQTLREPRASVRNESLKSAVTEQPPSPRQNTLVSAGTERPKTRSGHRGGYEQTNSVVKPVASKPMPESKISSLNSAAVEQPSSPPRKTVASGGTDCPKTSSSLSRETSIENAKNARHVHPKLPDYDSIAAHLQSLRTNRQ